MSADADPTGFTPADAAFMAEAIALGRTMLGRVAPNPAVGCVLVLDGRIVGRGATQAGGRPHAEAVALAEAGAAARGATAYVSLEPCAHESPRGPDCASSLAAAGIARCVAALIDPDPRTAGRGLARLASAGVVCSHGLLAHEARRANAGFLKRLATGRPWVATSADASSFDAAFELGRRETFEAALDRMGAAGLTRVHVAPGTPLALALAARDLLDDPE